MKFFVNLVLFGVCVFLFVKYIEKKSAYYPTREIEALPSDWGLSYEDVKLKAADGIRLSSWFIPARNSKGVILFCHGNGGNISHRLEKIILFHDLGLDVFIFDYRGYGLSAGGPSEKGLYLDTAAAYNYLTLVKKIDPEKIIVFGESLGSAMAVDLAVKKYLSGLILEGAFSSAKDMGKKIYPYLPGFLYTVKFDSFAKIKNISVPKLFFHSAGDEIAPYEFARKLFSEAKGAEFVEITGSHNEAFLDSKDVVIPKLKEFIEYVF